MAPVLIHDLSDDILREIFLKCLEKDHWGVYLLPDEAPMLLLRICVRWRMVALEYGPLWSRLNLPLRRETLDKTKCRYLVGVLKRAKAAPLSLGVRLTRSTLLYRCAEAARRDETPLPTPNLVQELVLPMAKSLSRLVLRGVPTEDIHKLPPGLLQSLESLVLCVSDAEGLPWKTAGPIKAFSTCVRLRRVLLVKFPVAVDDDMLVSGLHNILLPLKHLTHFFEFSSSIPASHFFTRYAHRCTKLQHLCLEIYYPDDIGDRAWPWVTCQDHQLPDLQPLTVSYYGSNRPDDADIGYPPFFHTVKFPNLRQLRLDGCSMHFDNHILWPPGSFEHFSSVLRSLRHFTTLSLNFYSAEPLALRKLFGATEKVSTLDVSLYLNFEHLFDALTPSDLEQAPLLPDLDTLILDIGVTRVLDDGEYDEEVIPGDVFAKFLEFRMRCAPERRKLRKLVVYTTAEHEGQVEDEIPFIRAIQEYASHGLVLERHVDASWSNEAWLRRDPKLADWPEAITFRNNMEIYT